MNTQSQSNNPANFQQAEEMINQSIAQMEEMTHIEYTPAAARFAKLPWWERIATRILKRLSRRQE